MADTEPDYSYTSASNDSANVRVIKQYALFLFKTTDKDTTLPTNTSWTAPSGVKPIGYSTEDGAVLHPEAGDDTEIKGHNGDVIYAESTGGYWTLQLAGVECKRSVAEAYFGVAVGSDGAIHLDDASTGGTTYNVVLAALDAKGRPLIVVLHDATVSERDDIAITYTDAIQLNMTFKGKKATGAEGHMLDLYGFAVDDAA